MFTVCIWNPPALLKCLVMFGPLTNEIFTIANLETFEKMLPTIVTPQSTVCQGNPNGTLPTTNSRTLKIMATIVFYVFIYPPCRIPVKNEGL